MPQEQPQRFWMVFVAGTRGPAKKHDTLVGARIEARRLADQTRATTYVLETTEYAAPLESEVWSMPAVTIEQFAEVHWGGKGR